MRGLVRSRSLHASRVTHAKIVCALYPDPISGFPPKYARDSIPSIKVYPDGQTTPSPKAIDFVPGEGRQTRTFFSCGSSPC
jgi:hypothetical protein